MRIALLAFALVLLGCDTTAPVADVDANLPASDAGSTPDGAVDAARDGDAPDATADDDADVDADIAPEAGLSDVGVDVDAAADVDAATDSDAGAGIDDAGAEDASTGTDAASGTTCQIAIDPLTGTTATSFTVTSTSNGTMCNLQADGGPMIAVGCTSTMSFPGSLLGVGTHTITLLVGAGPSGPTSCSRTVTITDASTCSISSSPTSGPMTTTFDLSWSSGGTTCSLDLPDGRTMTVACTGTTPLTGLAVGTHTVTLNTTGGAGGASTCATTITVFDASTPTSCTVSVSPESGPASATFVATFDSNGSTCTASVDGLSIGSVSCTGMFSGMGSLIGAGTHTATLNVGAGPSGPTSCTDTFTVTP